MKKILFSFLAILLLLAAVKSDLVPTTTGWIWTNITFDNRTLVDWDYLVENSSNCGATCVPSPVIANFERKEHFVVVQVIPMPDEACFYSYSNCSTAGYVTVVNLTYSRPGYKSSFWGGTKYSSNWGGAEVDTAVCWNWWAGENEAKRRSLQRECPVVAIQVEDYMEATNIFPVKSSGSGAVPDFTLRLLGYSANYVNLDDTMSAGIYNFIDSLTNFQDIILDFWRVIYFTAAALIVIADIVFIIGVLPLGLRWIVKKITGD